MCGAGVARSWCRGGSGGARNSQLFFGYVITGIFSKLHLDIITIITIIITTEENNIIRIRCSPLLLYVLSKYDHGGDTTFFFESVDLGSINSCVAFHYITVVLMVHVCTAILSFKPVGLDLARSFAPPLLPLFIPVELSYLVPGTMVPLI